MKQILLVGLPRSGTTWIAKVFDSSPDVFYLHEPDSEFRIPCVPFAPNVEDRLYWSPFIEDYLKTLHDRCSVRTCGKRPWFPKHRYSQLLWRSQVEARRVYEKLGGQKRVFHSPRAIVDSGTTLVWKSIESLGRVGTLACAERPLQIVHIVRHPCGFIESVLRGERNGRFTKSIPMSEDLGLYNIIANSAIGRELGLSLGRIVRCSPVERLAWFWTVLNTKAVRELHGCPRAHLISYDALCVQSPVRMQTVFEKLGLGWQRQTESFVRRSSQGRGTDYYSVERRSAVACEAWRERLSHEEICKIRDIVQATEEGKRCLMEQNTDVPWTSSIEPSA